MGGGNRDILITELPSADIVPATPRNGWSRQPLFSEPNQRRLRILRIDLL